MTMSELLRQVRVIDPVTGSDRQACDVLIVDGAIAAIAPQLTDYPADTQVNDCQGSILGTGLVDLYSHSGEPGFEERETLATLAAAAAAGGFTRVNLLPDTIPPVDNSAVVSRLLGKGQGGQGGQGRTEKFAPLSSPSPLSPQLPQLSFWGALTTGVQGQQMTELAELGAAGIVGFADGQPIENWGLLRRMLEYLKPLDKPVALCACHRGLVGNGVVREGVYSMRSGLPGNPAIAETTALAALLELVAAIGTPVHLMRVSTARSVELIATAKERGLPITASTTWMHLLLDTKALSSYNPALRLEPPLGNPEDAVALRQGVRTGVIDAIAIDHTPYTYEEKTVAFAEAPAGAIGLELALPLLWENLVATGEFSALELWQALSHRPAECLQQNVNAIAPNSPAELILFDPQHTWTVTQQTLKSRSHNTPWLGQQVNGRVVKIWL
ncbi:dihydroorotase [Chroococcidiopsis sp. FACHB-1243]|uniref:dihydroorotase n=1 Tax=Chroococcidiopsis sp. [FACHB-1243] TaxID=2692781 RepID=UPI00178004B1|nr:dihydroorotase [Chroococcidiopsis sp. [FACHB-1243]]MBD2304280.1 dihydroorotase [Chroococcidiopsis sp. [FACHB-1243]]